MHPSATAAQSQPLEETCLDQVAARSIRIANVLEAISRRRDVLELRCKMVLLLFRLRCSPTGQPMKAWYVPGAVARVGAEGLRRAWRGFYGEEAPSLRTIRSHLGQLEQSLVIVRQPGDWLPMAASAPREHRPRHPDTWHVLATDEEAEWWGSDGQAILERNPGARFNPDIWKRLLRGWRERLERIKREPMLPFLEAAAAAEGQQVARRELARGVARAARQGEPLAFLEGLRDAGVEVRGIRVQLALVRFLDRARGAAALLATALDRGDRIRNPAGWLVRAFRYAPELGATR